MARFILMTLLLAGAAAAQRREIGLLAGGSVSNGLPVGGAPLAATAGLGIGPTLGVLAGQDLYPHWSGEIRYGFERREFHINSAGASATFAGQAHAFHYDLVYHRRLRHSSVRPYLAFGGGAILFRGTGAETSYRPLMEDAYLTRTQQVKPMATIGGGWKIQAAHRMQVRIDVRDEITRFPEKIVAAAPGRKTGGWLHTLVPSVGVSWLF